MAEKDGKPTTVATGPKWVWAIPLIAALITGLIGPALVGILTTKTTQSPITVTNSPGAHVGTGDVTVNNDYSRTTNNYGLANKFVENWYSGARTIIGSPIKTSAPSIPIEDAQKIEAQVTALHKQVEQLSTDLKSAQTQLLRERQSHEDILAKERQSTKNEVTSEAQTESRKHQSQETLNKNIAEQDRITEVPRGDKEPIRLSEGQYIRLPGKRLLKVQKITSEKVIFYSDGETFDLKDTDLLDVDGLAGARNRLTKLSFENHCYFQLTRLEKDGGALVHVECQK